jgi:D-tyrosyl-tRNA(Tyr) deacylase
MRCVVQRVTSCSVTVEGETVGSIQKGLLVFLGVGADDSDREIEYCADKVINMRIYPDEQGKMNLSVLDTGGSILVVSQFTLYGDMRKGRRPSYNNAAPPEKAEEVYEKFLTRLRSLGLTPESGRFQAKMEVRSVNDGPVTMLVDSEKNF